MCATRFVKSLLHTEINIESTHLIQSNWKIQYIHVGSAPLSNESIWSMTNNRVSKVYTSIEDLGKLFVLARVEPWPIFRSSGPKSVCMLSWTCWLYPSLHSMCLYLIKTEKRRWLFFVKKTFHILSRLQKEMETGCPQVLLRKLLSYLWMKNEIIMKTSP